MQSLVKRLRHNKHNEAHAKTRHELEELCNEAADRLEKLERDYAVASRENVKLKLQIANHKRKQTLLKNQAVLVKNQVRNMVQ